VLDDATLNLCAMDADKVWNYDGMLKYLPLNLKQKTCPTLQLIILPLSHLEVYFLRMFQDEKLWQLAIEPCLKTHLGYTYESSKPVYNLVDHRNAFRQQLGNVHDFVSAASCGPKWAVQQLHKEASLLVSIVMEVIKYDKLRSFRMEMCRSFFGEGCELDDRKWMLRVCTDLTPANYVVLYEGDEDPLDFVYGTKSCLPDALATLERFPKPA
jgi:hypothetical protein